LVSDAAEMLPFTTGAWVATVTGYAWATPTGFPYASTKKK
jgi:hypothetical protein